jgi:hypothetical protein
VRRFNPGDSILENMQNESNKSISIITCRRIECVVPKLVLNLILILVNEETYNMANIKEDYFQRAFICALNLEMDTVPKLCSKK